MPYISQYRLLNCFFLQFVITSCLYICQLLYVQPCVSYLSNSFLLLRSKKMHFMAFKMTNNRVSDLTNFSRLWYTRACHGLARVQLACVQDRKKNRKGKKSRFFYERKIIVTLTLLHSTRDSSDL